MSPLTPEQTNGYDPIYPAAYPPAGLADIGMPTLMVIDDSPAVRAIIEASFNRVGVRVYAYRDGLEAIQALSRGDAPVPAVLLLDINLPRMTGYDVARILREHEQFKDTAILMLTGKDGIVDRVKSYLVGAREFIRKPFRVSDVVRTVGGYMQLDLPGPSESGSSNTFPGAPRG